MIAGTQSRFSEQTIFIKHKERCTTRENPSSSAGLMPISSAGNRATSKALQLKVSSSVGWTTLLLHRLSSNAF